MEIETKTGKSKKVLFYIDFVKKIPLNKDIEEYDLPYYIVMGGYGPLENIKEYYFWMNVRNNDLLRDLVTGICHIDYYTNVLTSEKTIPLDEEFFYKEILNKYHKLSEYSGITQTIFDHHTIDNHLNYGFDKRGNIKLLDYSIITSVLFDLYDLQLNDIKTYSDVNKVCSTIITDFKNHDIKKIVDINTLIPLILTLKYYNNPFKYYYYIYKYKILDLKSIFNMILDNN